MEDNPLVSIGIPTYNRPRGLHRTLEYIFKQTHTNIEVIISDNCSPQKGEIEIIINEFRNKNTLEIKYYRQNKIIEAADNFKFVALKATGNYFMFAADDDFMTSPRLIESLVYFSPLNILTFSDFMLVSENDERPFTHSYFNCRTSNDYFFEWLNNGGCYVFYGMYNLTLMKKFQIEFEFDTDLCYFNEGTFLHRIFILGKVKFVPGNYISYNAEETKVPSDQLFLSFLKYYQRTKKLYRKSQLNTTMKTDALKIINRNYSLVLFSFFLNSKRKEKIFLLLKNIHRPNLFVFLVGKFIYINIKQFYYYRSTLYFGDK